MKKLLEKQVVFSATLKVLSFFARRKAFDFVTQLLTSFSAKLNLTLNKPKVSVSAETLAKTWQDLMPPDGKENYKIKKVTKDTAYTEIHLHCPLRGTGNTEACYKLMNYDRKLMDKVGGNLIVLESQSSSGKNFCSLAIRAKGKDTNDLIPAHKK